MAQASVELVFLLPLLKGCHVWVLVNFGGFHEVLNGVEPVPEHRFGLFNQCPH